MNSEFIYEWKYVKRSLKWNIYWHSLYVTHTWLNGKIMLIIKWFLNGTFLVSWLRTQEGNRLLVNIFLWCVACGWLASNMNDTRMKWPEASLKKRSCYIPCQWYCYLRFQVSFNLQLSFFIPSTPALNETRLLGLYIIHGHLHIPW